ncbi:hypothetical protein M2145_000843 [Lachnospiraceae bacterium PF1-21]|uniref:Uncharacterized protein n=1 Tax=Ohessyouella blattaphilus TaxID=2949333 RepID=A0ABT1EH23_9FIRM|nr:hypothetical protein [Ohessyouella blattaphilus]MCP1108991.1 hypothetical protein [Ohessyouella blattaphilus]MCR8562385.1 hypothetical protein [Ohessyouella blattaphilus]MDL2251084.1 hypothetical protein [Lachnospiraceae bacterium OttesenSCG-928-J05]
MFIIRDDLGNYINAAESRHEALELVEKYYIRDLEDGFFKQNKYHLLDINNSEVERVSANFLRTL